MEASGTFETSKVVKRSKVEAEGNFFVFPYRFRMIVYYIHETLSAACKRDTAAASFYSISKSVPSMVRKSS